MKVNSVSKTSVHFGRALSTQEKEEALKIQKQALDILGCKKVITIIPAPSFPSVGENIGHGQLNSPVTDKFLDFWKVYTGITDLKVLPLGEVRPTLKKYYGSYISSSLTLGINNINLEELTTQEMGEILPQNVLRGVYKQAKETATKGLANFENTVGLNTPFDKALKVAYDNFISSDNANIKKLKSEFANYKIANEQYIEKRALFEALSTMYNYEHYTKWQTLDRELFNTVIISEDVRNRRLQELKSTKSKDIDFCYFKQFLADRSLAKAKTKMNKRGIKLVGDCLIGFSHEEIWGNPQAFLDVNIASKDWGLRALNFADLLDETSPASKLFTQKVEQFAKRYDSIRFDVGWSYVKPIVYPHFDKTLPDKYILSTSNGGYRLREKFGSKILERIENIVKKVKGEHYDLSNLMYEIEAGVDEFSPFDWDRNKIIPELQGRTIVQSTCYMNPTYATIDCLENRMHIPRKNYILMTNNHDHIALNALARGIDNDDILKYNGDNILEVLEKQYEPLARDLRLSQSQLKNPKEFVKAKFAYSFLSENPKMFFMDILGRSEQFDSQSKNAFKNYRYMISSDYERELHTAIQEERGLNIFDALYKAVFAKSRGRENAKLLAELKKYANILYEKGVKTEEEANELFNSAKNIKSTSKAGKIFLSLLGFCGLCYGSYEYYKKQNCPHDKITKKQKSY